MCFGFVESALVATRLSSSPPSCDHSMAFLLYSFSARFAASFAGGDSTGFAFKVRNEHLARLGSYNERSAPQPRRKACPGYSELSGCCAKRRGCPESRKRLGLQH